jgi:hypothetical protein
MKAVKLLVSLIAISFSFAQNASALSIQGVNYEKLVSLSNVSISTCGAMLHTGFSMSSSVSTLTGITASQVAPILASVPLSSLQLKIEKVVKDTLFTHKGNNNHEAKTTGGTLTLTGIVNGTRQTLMSGTYGNSVFAINTSSKNVTWNTTLNITGGLVFNALGGLQGTSIALYQEAVGFKYTAINTLGAKLTIPTVKDIISNGGLTFYYPNNGGTAIPEPMSAALVLSGLAAALVRKRSLRAKNNEEVA